MRHPLLPTVYLKTWFTGSKFQLLTLSALYLPTTERCVSNNYLAMMLIYTALYLALPIVVMQIPLMFK